MGIKVILTLILPLLGTSLGAGMVFFLKEELPIQMKKLFIGFASGVMIAASFWSLLLPSLEQAAYLKTLSFLPAAIGFIVGLFFLLILDVITPHIHMDNTAEGPKSGLKRTTKLVLAITLHNIPEGMAVGAVMAAWLSGNQSISFFAALALSLGIAIQNFPEGAIVSMPLLADGEEKMKTFWMGVLSGVVEPLAALITVFFSKMVVDLLPYLLSFAAGAMLYVVVEEMIPELQEGHHSNLGTISFGVGFVLMMILDVLLG